MELPRAWAEDVERFQKMSRHPRHVQLKAVAGDHDVGCHAQMSTYRIKRFEDVFNPARLFSWKGINSVMVDSVALEGDGCSICSEAEAEVVVMSQRLNCSGSGNRAAASGAGQPLPLARCCCSASRAGRATPTALRGRRASTRKGPPLSEET